MADMHVISGDGKGTWQVAMHFDIPDANNAVGVNVRLALVRSGLATVSVLLAGDGIGGTITTTETAQLASGEKFEHVVSVFLDGPGADSASQLALLRERYNFLNSQVIDRLTGRLNFFGLNVARS